MEIFISRNGQQFGPYTLGEVQADLNAGNVVETDLAWHEGASEWVKVSQIDGLNVPKKRVPPPPPPPPLSASPPRPPLNVVNVPQQPYNVGEMVIVGLVSLFVPLVGLIVGGIRASKPERRNEGLILLGISVFLVLFYMVVLFH